MRRLCWGLALAALAAATPTRVMADEAYDQAMAKAIASSLKHGGQMKAYNIAVQYKDGQAVLNGNVSSEEQRYAALSIARQTDGVTNVIDQLEVRGGQSADASSAKRTLFASNTKSTSAPGGKMTPASSMAAPPRGFAPASNIPGAPGRQVSATAQGGPAGGQVSGGAPIPAYVPGVAAGVAPARYDQPYLPNHAWPAYAAYPNYGAVTYPKQYSATAWPYIGPFYPYPQVPLGWRKVTLEWDDGWWMLDFKARRH